MEYKIVSLKVSGIVTSEVQKTADALAKEVNDQISLGWEPLGGVAMGHTGAVNYLLQALVKRR
jgi:hypothetical protein